MASKDFDHISPNKENLKQSINSHSLYSQMRLSRTQPATSVKVVRDARYQFRVLEDRFHMHCFVTQ